ncbi:hypothetical protein ACWGHD_18985 [Streptomyces xanthophaeus]
MSAEEELIDALVQAEAHSRGREGATDRAVDLLARYNAERAAGAPMPAMSRADALKIAREHVEAMATNTRGYQDGVSLAGKVSAVDTFARFLLGEESE